MFWDEDLEFALRPKVQQPKKGRRAHAEKQAFKEENAVDDTPPQIRKTGGWADEALKGRKNSRASNILEQERFKEHVKSEDLFSSIPVIPDVDDIAESTPDHNITAPSVVVNRTETYTQISKDLMKNSVLATLGSTDFSILSETLASEEQLKDLQDDEPWTFDSLFSQLSESYYSNDRKLF